MSQPISSLATSTSTSTVTHGILVVGATRLVDARPSSSKELLIVLLATDLDELAEQPTLPSHCQQVEQAIATAYVSALAVMQRTSRPWLTVTVTLYPWCKYEPGVSPHWEAVWCSSTDTLALQLAETWREQREQLHHHPLTLHTLPHNEDSMSLSTSPPSTSSIPPTSSDILAAHYHHDRLFCGVTDTSMLKNKQYSEWIEPLETRIKHVEHFLHTLRPYQRRYTVACITDPFGPTITDPTIDVIAVSRETLKGGKTAQEERVVRGLPPMSLHMIDVIAAGRRSLGETEWSELKLSSTQIRARLEHESLSHSTTNVTH
ncbi:hypothetical protein BDF22DRAFT_699776 [Syncephalis plumigaleata]|nr:hypothetical protein BDF22DRAFT_699776 [Syncephalis plumigaleata]